MPIDPSTAIWPGHEPKPGRANPLRPGAEVDGRYRIADRLGSGGFGTVYRATDARSGRAVALKVLHYEFVDDAEARQRFEREAALAAKLRHPNTLVLHDYGVDGVLHYIVSELLDGRSLWEELRESGCFSTARTAYVAKQVLKSLAEAHELGIVHRDIKPTNLFLAEFAGEQDFVKVLDYGIAKDLKPDQITEFKEVADVPRTPRYMAPEQFLARKARPASDLYALGLVMAEMIDGAPVFKRSPWDCVQAKLEQTVPPFPQSVLDSPLAPVIQWATQRHGKDRQESALEMLAQLEAATAPEPIPSAPVVPRYVGAGPASGPPGVVPVVQPEPAPAATAPSALPQPGVEPPLPQLPMGPSPWWTAGILIAVTATVTLGAVLAWVLLGG
ncbi:MAG: serine/threonine protein kinase [Deltaproteobacteria bacterium]|nr:serine/threonine protein kinase [Deltaproteobacteria bacterium]MBW2531222.1 serine/threonine protein kinase [Deltaproteobacteria bacterium]